MFELHITCTKDIDKIQIDFSDGSTCMTETKKESKSKKDESHGNARDTNSRDAITHKEAENVAEVIVEKPKVPDEPKEPSVEDYLQGLEF